MARVWRVHHTGTPPARDEIAVLSAEETHHVHRVLRLRTGDPLHLFDGHGREWETTLTECGPGRAAVRMGVELTDRVEPDLDLVLFQGMCRPERMEWVIQKATECGSTAVNPLVAARGSGPRLTEARLSRWRRVAVEACKQSGRRRIPRVEPVDTLPGPDHEELALLLDPSDDATPLAGLLSGTRPGAVWLAVGPESGFTDQEIEAYIGMGWRRAGLGPRTLRTETAGIVAAAIVLHRWADLGSVL